MSTPFFIPVILGTARAERESAKVAKLVLSVLQKNTAVQTELVDVEDFLFGRTSRFDEEKNTEAARWHDIAFKAHGFILIAPEYNRGYPGELKILLDSLYDEYDKKPVAFVGVSSGPLGGARGVEQLKLVAVGLRMIPVPDSVYISGVEDAFDSSGALKETSYLKKIERMLTSLLSYL